MEKSFIVNKESQYHKDIDKYIELSKQQSEFVEIFCKEHNIEAKEFCVGGDGLMNRPFEDWYKDDIKFSIIPTENDLNNHSKMLRKPDSYGLCTFKKKSKLAKIFAQRCVDEKIIINLYSYRISDYFKSLSYHGCNYSRFVLDDIMYLKVKSDYLKEDDIPEGFIEIKNSEFYKKLEEFEELNK